MDKIFVVGDPAGAGTIDSHAARKLFTGAALPTEILDSIWDIANVEENTVFGRHCVGVALRLVGHAQKGRSVTPDLVNEGSSHSCVNSHSKPGLIVHRILQRVRLPLSTGSMVCAASRGIMRLRLARPAARITAHRAIIRRVRLVCPVQASPQASSLHLLRRTVLSSSEYFTRADQKTMFLAVRCALSSSYSIV